MQFRRGVLIALAAVLALTITSTAMGGPSPIALAKKALRVANGANTKASSALQAAQAARSVRVVQVESGDIPVPPGGFGRFELDCPSGGRATGFAVGLGAIELVGALTYGNGYLGSGYNPSSSTTYDYSVTVNCLINGENVAVTSGNAKGKARTEAAELAKEYRSSLVP